MTSDELLQKKALAIIRPIRFNYKRTTDKHEGCLRERIKPQIIYFQFDHVSPPFTGPLARNATAEPDRTADIAQLFIRTQR